MKDIIGGILYLVGGFGYIVGCLALFGLFCTGVYTFFADSILIGLAMIGGAVVGSVLLQFLCGLLMVTGEGIARWGR